MTTLRKIATATFIGAGLLAGAASVSAQQAAPPTPQTPQGGMAGPHGMMQGSGMMPMMEQMSKMMENCNRMMQSHMDRQDTGGSRPQPQGNRG
jgi:hypothetical protein